MTALPIVLMTEEEVAALGRDSDASFGALRTERGLLPLAAMDVDARVAGVVAAIDLAQTFVNTTGQAIEATYIFPLPDRAAVHRFRMEVAGRVIEGVVDERGAARVQYDEAIARGHRAAITEEERPGVFTLRVGNLMPGEAATVRLSLVGPLPVDDGEVTFRFPLVVAPRYIPGAALGGDQAGLGTSPDTDLVPDASRISPPVLLPGCPNPVRLGLRVALEDTLVSEVASSLHAVTTKSQDGRVIELQPSAAPNDKNAKLDRDFILRWRVGGRELASSLVCIDDADGKAGTFMLTFVPPTTAAVAAKPRDVVFLLDRSGSMEGWKMVAARRAIGRMIDTLTSRDRFSVIAFDDQIEVIPGALEPASDRTRFRAIEQIGKIDSRGGTELAEPLDQALRAFGSTYDDRERVIVLVTDGQVGNEDHLLRAATKGLKNIRMFTLGIDQAVNGAFLRRLASAGGGLCELVESEDRLDAVMAKVHRRIGVPVATELEIRASGLDVSRPMLTPRKLPDVYAGAPVVVFGRYGGTAPTDASLAIEGTSFGDPLKLTIARDPMAKAPPARTSPAGAATSWLAASWARAYIRDLEDRYAAGDASVAAEIVKTSKQFSVLSRFTAFLAVDRSEVANPGGRLTQVVQPVEEPAGWEMRKAAMPARAAMAMPMQAMARPMAPPGGGAPMKSMAVGAAFDMDDTGDDEVTERGEAGYSSEVDLDALRSLPPPPPRTVSMGRSRSAPPKAPASPVPQPAPKQEAAKEASGAVRPTAYLEKLVALGREIAAATDLSALRMIRQRLVQWLEDVRSVGELELAAAIEPYLERMVAAIASSDLDACHAVGTELVAIGSGGPVPAPPKKSRLAFWK